MAAMAALVQAYASGTSKRQQRLRPEEQSLKNYVLWQAYMSMTITGLGYLALTWSTVVLLGGFVSTLGKKDFWCLTAITMIQAARILSRAKVTMIEDILTLPMILIHKSHEIPNRCISGLVGILCSLLMPVVIIIGAIYLFGSFICVGLSVWRLVQRDYGNIDWEGTQANLMPALDIFYSLVLCQCALFFVRFIIKYQKRPIVASLGRVCNFPEKWSTITIQDYYTDTKVKYWQNPASIKGSNLVDYAVNLMGSESSQDYLSGARMVDMFIKQGVDLRSLFLPSRPKIQKLIGTLRWRSSDREIRELAARILAYLARDINLSQFPGAIRCISSLLDTTLPYWYNQQEANDVKKLQKDERKDQEGDDQQGEMDSSIHGSKGDCWNELILQGLTILERLAFDQHNCRDICSTPGLLPKIMAPLYSKMLTKHINASAWADVVNGSLKVVHRLMRAPGRTGRRLRREIASSKQAVSNLEGILDQTNNASLELHMRAIEILRELAFDLRTNLSKETKENIIEKQTQIFLTDDQGKEEESATKFTELKVTAGKALVLLSGTELLSQTGSISVFIESKYNLIVQRLTEMLDARNKIIYRTTAAKILENLCSHHTMETKDMKDILLPKVLTEVLSSKGGPQNKISTPGNDAANRELSAEGSDEENQVQGHNSQIKSSSQENEEHTAMMGFQEAFLSLTLAICNKLKISAGDLDDVARKIPHRDGEVVANLKAIVEENCDVTADCLRIVKLCGEISVLMMKRSQYIPHFRDQQFVQSLSKAVKNMSNLESCILFAGTDCGAKKPVEPLLYELEEYVLKLVS